MPTLKRDRTPAATAQKDRVSVLLLEDMGLLRDTFRASLESAGYWVLQAATLKDAERKAANKPRAALIDIALRGPDTDSDGLEAARLIKAISPDTLCMVVTDAQEESLPHLVRKAILAPDDSRFDGFVLKRPGFDHVMEALKILLEHDYYMESRLARHLYVDADSVPTEEEVVVIRHLQAGLKQTEIAARLFVSGETVRRLVRSAKQKLGVSTPAALVQEAEKKGYLRDEPNAETGSAAS